MTLYTSESNEEITLSRDINDILTDQSGTTTVDSEIELLKDPFSDGFAKKYYSVLEEKINKKNNDIETFDFTNDNVTQIKIDPVYYHPRGLRRLSSPDLNSIARNIISASKSFPASSPRVHDPDYFHPTFDNSPHKDNFMRYQMKSQRKHQLSKLFNTKFIDQESACTCITS
mmetsp:Transcript_4445/g.3980  ORF Transcript_4445/g.3980 Transcript_4445/m.3980 type:complete len:172 (-) Transcript_4445:177-692(-)